IHALGMAPHLAAMWEEMNLRYLESQQRASDVSGGFGSVSKAARMAFQSAVLGVGAYLVIIQEATGGVIIAGSILAGRALAPVDLAIADWRGYVAFRQSWRRLRDLLAQVPAENAPMKLPRPHTALSVEGVSIVAPGTKQIVARDILFSLKKGEGLGIVGPS